MLPHRLELRRLRYFLVLAEELHFARAAQRLNMAQPPLSEQIRKLEDELGFRLFNRNSRNVALTEAGHIFLTGARAAMVELERAINIGQQTERGHSGHLRLGIISSVGITFLPRLLRRLRRELPHVRTETRQFTSNGALEALAQHTIDLAIVRTPLVGEKLRSRPICQDRVMLAMPHDHPLHKKKRLKLADLRDTPFVLYPPNAGHAAYSVALRACMAAGFVPTVAEYVDDVYGMLGQVAAGSGVALVPEAIRSLHVENTEFRDMPDVQERFELSLAWRAEDDRSLMAAVLKVLEQA